MKFNLITWSVILSATFAMLTGPTISFGDDLNPPPYRGMPATVVAEFDFNDGGLNPSPPTNFGWIEGPNGEPLDDQPPCVQFDQFFEFGNGEWHNLPIKPGFFQIKMPNIIDDFPVKHIRLQITWAFNGPSNPPQIANVLGDDAEQGPLTEVTFLGGSTMVMGNMRHTTYNIRVKPNPDREVINAFASPGMTIKQIVVDTISVPATIPGDVNGDGMVNLLDVGPFVAAVSSGQYSPAADVNDDGVVNLLDVQFFIELLSK